MHRPLVPHLRPPRARGAAAVQFALLAFGFFALAAVVVDMRLATHTQNLMQVAADDAALEGVRWRDEAGGNELRPAARDCVALAFDDDLDAGNGDPQNFGAGPALRLVGGRAEDNALARLDTPTNPVYDPSVQLNSGNDAAGDIVTGTFDPTVVGWSEADDYTRNDFTPVAPGGGAEPDAVLVRLRRTNDEFGLDNVPGVSSAGPALPFLFGMGSTMKPATEGSDYNPRTQGLTVRATAIAAARRAVSVSGPGPAYGRPALQRFILLSPGPHFPTGQPFPPPGQQFPPPGSLGSPTTRFPPPGQRFPPPGQSVNRPGTPPGLLQGIWDELAVGEEVVVRVDADGYLRLIGNGAGNGNGNGGGNGGGNGNGNGNNGNGNGNGNGNVNDPPGNAIGFFAVVGGTANDLVHRVGQIPDPYPLNNPYEGETYVPIARPIDGYFWTIGFGRIQVTVVDSDPLRIRITKLRGTVQVDGASALTTEALAELAGNAGLRQAHSDFPDPISAPVLVR